jgi:hypothetical protein
MNPNSLESDYMALLKTLESHVGALAKEWPAMMGFWERWTKDHLAIARDVSSQHLSGWHNKDSGSQWSSLLKQRQRLVSAAGQGLKAHGERESIGASLNQLLANHDSRFVGLLQKELEQVKQQMTHAFAIKKTVAAYAQTAQFRGE